ncbi:hypothetical protein C2845_PM06G10750 [Panicum miliaceum]|uniref:Uncharacterized protein n=1 Tax=Panicum miliaceum TaxID=4540 RepID=A0A3L6RFB6_PANMI|nr:hypothetical protein C2845_PM06G10750 [Panicum miliaceum]
MEVFRYTMFCLLVLMYFAERLGEPAVAVGGLPSRAADWPAAAAARLASGGGWGWGGGAIAGTLQAPGVVCTNGWGPWPPVLAGGRLDPETERQYTYA